MTRLDRIERALWALVNRIELECKANSPGHRDVKQLLEMYDNGLWPLPDGMGAVTLTMLRGILDMRKVLEGANGTRKARKRPPTRVPHDTA